MLARELLIKVGFKVDRDKLNATNKGVEQLKRNATTASQSVGSLAQSMKRAFVGLGISAGLALIGRELVTTVSLFEKLRAQLETIEGSSAKAEKAFARLQDFATSTPFQLQNVVDSFAKLRAVGLDPTNDDLRALGDTAAGMSKDIVEMAEAAVAATTGEMERLKAFGIVAKQQGNQVTFHFKGQKTKIKKDANAIFGYLTNLGKVHFSGGMQRQMSTVGGAFSNLQDNIAKFFDQIGRAGFGRALSGFIKELTGIVGEGDEAAVTIGETLASALKSLTDLLRWGKENAYALKVALAVIVTVSTLHMMGQYTLAIQAGGKAMLLLKVQSLKAAAATTLLGLKMMLIVGAFALMALAVEDIVGFFEGKNSVIGQFLDTLGYSGGEAAGVLKEALYGIATALSLVLVLFNPITGLVALLATLILWLVENSARIVPAFQNAWDEIYNFFRRLFGLMAIEVSQWIKSLGDIIGGAAASIWFPIEDAFRNLMAFLSAEWGKFIQIIEQGAERAVKIASRVASAAANPLDTARALIDGDLSPTELAGEMIGGGAASPAVDMNRRVSEVRNNRREINVRANVPIQLAPGDTGPNGLTPQGTSNLRGQVMDMFGEVVDGASADLEGALD